MVFGESGIGSTNNPLIDVFPHSHYLSAYGIVSILYGEILFLSLMGV